MQELGKLSVGAGAVEIVSKTDNHIHVQCIARDLFEATLKIDAWAHENGFVRHPAPLQEVPIHGGRVYRAICKVLTDQDIERQKQDIEAQELLLRSMKLTRHPY